MKLHKILFIAIINLCFVANSHAAKFSLMFGSFGVTATSDISSGTLSGVGLYSMSYEYPLLPFLDFGLGYTVIMSELVGGDMMFGPDLKVNYYPFSNSNPTLIRSKKLNLTIEELWRFYGSVGFHQRQVQSVRVAYSGLSIGAGAEYFLNPELSLKSEVRYISMKGASNGVATEFTLSAGIVKGFW
jgi:opacity protein-like surface antigen